MSISDVIKINLTTMKKKNELEIAAEKVEKLIGITNNKINELGTYNYCLFHILNIIQKQIDKIRNIPSETEIEYLKLKETQLKWRKEVEKIAKDYDNAQNAQKVYVETGAVFTGLGIGVVTLGPAAAMGIATTFGVASTGTAISALSGATATKAALAWLGGGALSAGGGGVAAGQLLIGLSGPIGWTIASLAIIGSGVLLFKIKSDKDRLKKLFLLVSDRDQHSYKLAITELQERINKIISETEKLKDAIVDIGSFGYDYNIMTKEQRYNLGSYVNFMKASIQLLVSPIKGLKSNIYEEDIEMVLEKHPELEENYTETKAIAILKYLCELLYGILFDWIDFKLLINSLRKNNEFLEAMYIKDKKKLLNEKLFDIVNEIICIAEIRKNANR